MEGPLKTTYPTDTQILIAAAQKMPRRTPAPGGAFTQHPFQVPYEDLCALETALVEVEKMQNQPTDPEICELILRIRDMISKTPMLRLKRALEAIFRNGKTRHTSQVQDLIDAAKMMLPKEQMAGDPPIIYAWKMMAATAWGLDSALRVIEGMEDPK